MFKIVSPTEGDTHYSFLLTSNPVSSNFSQKVPPILVSSQLSGHRFERRATRNSITVPKGATPNISQTICHVARSSAKSIRCDLLPKSFRKMFHRPIYPLHSSIFHVYACHFPIYLHTIPKFVEASTIRSAERFFVKNWIENVVQHFSPRCTLLEIIEFENTRGSRFVLTGDWKLFSIFSKIIAGKLLRVSYANELHRNEFFFRLDERPEYFQNRLSTKGSLPWKKFSRIFST